MALTPACLAWSVAALLVVAGTGRAQPPPAREALQAAAQSEAATQSGAEAAYELGLDYDLGTSGPEDTAAALRWYRRAAEAGLPAAEFNVAVMLDAGRGTARDPSGAALWYAKAAAHGHARAAYDLGQLYAAGDGPPRNAAAAAAWFTQASALPAATRKLVALRAEATASARDGALLAPTPASPVDGGTLPRGADRAAVELVWTAPAEPAPVRYFVELVALGGGPARRLFAGFADVTAVLASLEDNANLYAWRVYAVDAAGGRYAASPWARFTTVPPPTGG